MFFQFFYVGKKIKKKQTKIKNKQTIRTTNSSYAICTIQTDAARDCPLFLIIQNLL